MLSIKEQEDFMHLLYDCIHIGTSLDNLEYSLQNMQEKYGNEIYIILNTPMKNEKYLNNNLYPLFKVIQTSSSQTNDQIFLDNKLNAIKILLKYGCKTDIITNLSIEWKYYIDLKIIDYNIQHLFFEQANKITISI
jgi:hypothetical protein